jgi:hypothetical protein
MKIRFNMIAGSLALLLVGSNMAWADTLTLQATAPQAASKYAQLHTKQYIGPDFDWKLASEARSADGNKVLRFAHTYHGIALFQSESVYVLNSSNERIGEAIADRRSDLLLFLAGKGGASFSLHPSVSEQDAILAAEQDATARMSHAELVLYPVTKYVRQPAALRKNEAELNALDLVRVVDHFELAYRVSALQPATGDYLISARDGRVLQRSDSGEVAGLKASNAAILAWATQALSAGKASHTSPEQQVAVQDHADLAAPKAHHPNQWSTELNRYHDLLDSGNPNKQMFQYLAFGDDAARTIKGIGLEKAFRILTKASSEKFTDASDYADAQAKMIEAARELYGAGGSEENAVKQAFAAINVGGNATLGASSCSRIVVSPVYSNNLFPWNGGTVTGTAVCTGAQSYSWTVGGAPYGGNGQSINGTLGQNTSGQVTQTQVCVTPYNGGTPGIAACTALLQDYLRVPNCTPPTTSPTVVPAAGGNVTGYAHCYTVAPTTYSWTVNGGPFAGNGATISGVLGLNSSTNKLTWPVCVTATNAAGSSPTTCGQLVQAANSIPRCTNISFSPGQVPRAGGSVSATAICSGTVITSYSWTANGSSYPGNGAVISATFPANTGPTSTIRVCATATNVIGTSPQICSNLTVQ